MFRENMKVCEDAIYFPEMIKAVADETSLFLKNVVCAFRVYYIL